MQRCVLKKRNCCSPTAIASTSTTIITLHIWLPYYHSLYKYNYYKYNRYNYYQITYLVAVTPDTGYECCICQNELGWIRQLVQVVRR